MAKFKPGDILKGISNTVDLYKDYFNKNGLYKLRIVKSEKGLASYNCIYCGKKLDGKKYLIFEEDFGGRNGGIFTHLHHFKKATKREEFLYHLYGSEALINVSLD